MSTLPLKQCSKCSKWKTIEQYYKDPKKRDGLRSNCKNCDRLRHCHYNQTHREEILKKSRQRYAENREKRSEKWKASYYANREQNIQRVRQWQKTYPEKHVLINQRRRFLIREAGIKGNYTADEWLLLCEFYDNRCLACGERGKLSVDHVVPIKKGGDNLITNIQPLCKTCNSKKGKKIIDYRITVPGWIKVRISYRENQSELSKLI